MVTAQQRGHVANAGADSSCSALEMYEPGCEV